MKRIGGCRKDKHMTDKEEKEFLKRISNAKSHKIFVEDGIKLNSCIRGVYGFFAKKENEEIPFYIGKSNNIFTRMFCGHIYDYLRGVRKTDVQKNIESFLSKGYEIHVKILKVVEYKGDSFIQDANRLALAELNEIVNQQNRGFCITEDQLSEAVKKRYEKKEWDNKCGRKTGIWGGNYEAI